MKELIEHLLDAHETQLDSKMKPYIEKWDEPPTSLQVLEVLDKCVHGSLCSGFVVRVLEALYDMSLKREGKTHEEVVNEAPWRREV